MPLVISWQCWACYLSMAGKSSEVENISYATRRGEWGEKMHQDLLDQVDWAVNKGIADKDHFGILGGSYGGYATLVGATMTPDVFACAISIVGPSTLEKFMPHWNVDMMSMTLGGDPRTEEGLKFLASRSPVNFAHQTKIPVLVVQGAEDARVPQAQSDIIVEKMQKTGTDITYLLYPDEGHGIVKPHNTKSLWGISEQFLANCLGGRAEPIGNKLEGSTLQVPIGADNVKGLAEILEKIQKIKLYRFI
jgi:dipeptidyl aminopeptidase/acylaminoacyl peptidase